MKTKRAKSGEWVYERSWAARAGAGMARLCGAALVLAAAVGALAAQTAGASASGGQSASTSEGSTGQKDRITAGQESGATGSGVVGGQLAQAAGGIPALAKPEKEPHNSDQRRAARLYLESSKLFLNRQFEEAMQGFERAAELDPSNADYPLAAQVARNHEVTALIQESARDRLLGNESGARDALTHAFTLDPRNFEVSQHLDQLADDVAREQSNSLYSQTSSKIASPATLLPVPGARSFHQNTDQRQLIEQVFKAYGVVAMLDDSVRSARVRLDVDDVNFEDAARILGWVTHSFYVPLDAHHVLVANDTRENRQRLIPEQMETVYLAGMSSDDMNEVETLAKNVFEVQETHLSQPEQTLTLHAPAETLEAFNATMRSLLNGRSEVLLDVRMIQVAHTSDRNTGTQFSPSITAFNVYAEEESLLSQNASLVQEIISSGLAPANDPLAILGILIASGQISSPLLSSGFALFGGGLAESALSPGPVTFNLSINTSDSRELDQIELHLEDGQDETLKDGEKYPIQTSAFTGVGPKLPSIPGLTGVGSSSSLSSLLSSLSTSVPNIPMVQYQDLGLTLKLTPKVLRDDDVALSIDMKLSALAGTFVDGNPVLDNRAYSGVVTLKEGEAVVVATEMDKSQSLAISGTPGISEIPGLNNVTGKDLQQNYATLVIVMTPHVIRGPQAAGHTAMMRVATGER